MDNTVREQTAMHVVATYMKLLELQKQMCDPTLVKAIAEQAEVSADDTAYIFTAMAMQKKELQQRLRTQTRQLATLLRQSA